MPKCPHCDLDITELKCHETKEYSSTVEVVDRKLDHTEESVYVESSGYSCPECGEGVSTSDEEALQFLQGQEETKEQAHGQDCCL